MRGGLTNTDPGGIDAIERILELRADPERVWRAVTRPEEIARWFGDSAELEAREGAEGWFGWSKYGRFAVRVEGCEPPRLFAWRWAREEGKPLDETRSTRVEWELVPRDGGGTVLHLRESGFEHPEDREDNVGGWKHELDELLEYLGEPADASNTTRAGSG
ncbi:MAG TPA: SRPBCC domain-containing protein [Thermoanaerobaculia bacterium]